VILTLLYINSEVVIPAKAGIQFKNNGFPRVKHGAGFVKPGMTNNGKGFLSHCITWLDAKVSPIPKESSLRLVSTPSFCSVLKVESDLSPTTTVCVEKLDKTIGIVLVHPQL
jgi:hypothetical protein